MKEPAGLDYEIFEAGHTKEWLMRIGPRDAPSILFLPALFEEMNRTRALTAATMRLVAARGLACWLPDLPGTGESHAALENCAWEDWQSAIAAAARHVSGINKLCAVASIRGGALLDGHVPAPKRWRFAPVDGTSLVRDLSRAGLMGGGGSAGYSPPPGLLAALETAQPTLAGDIRTLRLASDRNDADHKVAGSALWRRSEPATSEALATALADDILKWIG
ncbi:alpha/beta hydrolase family protein [Sphingosinicella rhizophila]|uniref:Alpha/beta hydrolase n=1 Tax=Sphingosinicella rhizophila TaxID=3050082 RepID=A0ABU3Q2X3_9SPHN|nr:hypothetical protein [Sphingosinicella sp. GR2756]MDT9597766.1 hypothetical protein [Sphingosinicella sp. GR2756]